MPRTQASDDLHAMKYRGPREDFDEAVNRVSFGLADNGHHYHALRDIMLPQRFCPGGRVQGAIGATRQTTAQNCYVSRTIDDSIEGIMDALKEAALTSKMGGGIGYDFSTIRPKGYRVKKIETDATGPVSFMEYFNTVGLGIASSGHRRGAQMAILRVDHPDVEEFIRAKQKPGALEGFNVSVAVTDKFMEAVAHDQLFPLSFGGSMDREVRAVDLWQKIMRATWDWAEPGCFFIDTVNRMNNLWYCEQITATNPCGEQPLPPFGACLLGSFNLPAYLKKNHHPPMMLVADNVIDDNTAIVPSKVWYKGDPSGEVQFISGGWYFDFDQLCADIPHVVRGMDNVVDRTLYPLPEQKAEAKAKRRMGLGVMGLANAGEALGFPYGSIHFLQFEATVLEVIRDGCYRASADLAKEKGSFPLYNEVKYPSGNFIATLPDDIQDLIRKQGIRNSHLTSIAPTGTISMCADNVSGGIEPVFAHAYRRPVNTPTGKVDMTIEDYGVAFLGVKGKLSADVTPQEHVDVLVTAQRYVDSAVSKTCNTTGETPWGEFTGIYSKVHAGGGKGCTTFNRDGKRGTLITASAPATADDGPNCAVDPETGRRDCA